MTIIDIEIVRQIAWCNSVTPNRTMTLLASAQKGAIAQPR